MELFTDRLRLREYVESDVDTTHRWRCDPAYLEHYPGDGFDRRHTMELIERFIGWQSESPRRRWQLAIERVDTGQFIGSGGVRRASDRDGADIGYELDPQHWGHGFATEAMARLVRFAIEEAGLTLLTARTSQANKRSLRVLERLGFQCAEAIPAGSGRDGTEWPDQFEYHLRAATLRPAQPSDSEFAYRVKEAAFRPYMEMVKSWDEVDQRREHDRRFAEQPFQIVMRDETAVGVIVLVMEQDCVKLNQLFIHPDHQGCGLGGQCLWHTLRLARERHQVVRLQCLKVNPRAVVFYERYGFGRAGETDTHLVLETALK